MTRVGKKLKALRDETGLSGRKFAELLDVPWASYSNWEHSTKKPYLPIDIVKSMIPVFAQFGIEAKRVLELAGIDETILQEVIDDKIELDDGRTAKGIAADRYTSTSEVALVRPVVPGLVVAAEVKTGKEDTSVDIYEIGIRGKQKTLKACREGAKPQRYSFDQNWFDGEVDIDGKASKCRIVLVVREVVTPYNRDHL